MNCSDRCVVSRAEGFNPQLLLSLTTDQRKKIEEGSYEAALFGSLFNGVLPPHANMLSCLLPVAEENAFQTAASNPSRTLRALQQKIPDAPIATLDMSGGVDDFYTHSVALWRSNAAVILGNSCYLISDVGLAARVIKQVYARNDALFGLACVEWLNPTTLAVGYQRSSELYIVDTALVQSPKCQVALMRMALGQPTRITRLSNNVFLTGHKNGEVVYNDAKTGQSSSLLEMRHSSEAVCSIAPSKDAGFIAVGYDNGSVKVYERTAQKTFAFVRSYSSNIFAAKRALAWFPGNQRRFICGGGRMDSVLRVFDTGYAEAVASHALPFAITNIVFTGDRQFVATYGNCIGHFVLADSNITLLKEVATSSLKRVLDAVYNPEAGLITTSAGVCLNIWPPIPPNPSQNQSRKTNLDVIR